MNVIGISGLHNSVPFKKKEFPNLTPRHYRIAQGFDSASALINSNGIEAVAAEERFSRQKATGSFPVNAIRYCLQKGNLDPKNVDYIAHGFCYEPYRSYFEHDDFFKRQFDEIYSQKAQIQAIQEHFPSHDLSSKLIGVPHHLAHAASTFYVSGFEEALILVTDGMGEIHSTTIAVGQKNEMKILKQVRAVHSLGIFYGVLTYYLGFFMDMDEYKVMGLAPYGNPRRHFGKFMELVHLKDDGTYAIPILFQNESILEKETYGGTLQHLADIFGPLREPDAELTQDHMDIAAGLQACLQSALLHMLQHFKRETGLSNLCTAGGVALNCTANGVIKRSRMFQNMFVQPAAGDDGSALGAALYVQHQQEPDVSFEKMVLPLWGPSYDNQSVAEVLKQYPQCESTYYASFGDLAADVAKRLNEGQIVGWFQGAMEFGPRALGNRSILADPRDPGMRDLINSLVKKREGFRPFAPAVTSEAASKYFDIEKGDESIYSYMLFVTKVRPEYRPKFPAITHVDGSARVQTVFKEENPRFWTILNEFEKVSGVPILLNTSFNVKGQPIVCTPQEGVDTFLMATLDVLVIENYVVVMQDKKQNRPARSL